MRNMFYAILAALLVSGVAFARTIVIPVQPVAIDDLGAEVPDVFVPGIGNSGTLVADGAYWPINLAEGVFSCQDSNSISCTDGMNVEFVWCTPIGQTAQQECYAPWPTISLNAPLHVELR